MPRVLILGIGNVLWADEGFGVRCVEHLAQSHAFGADVQLLDGGTQGLYLLPFLEEADILVVFDAVDYGLAPGTLKIVEGDEVPAFMGAKKMSLHQTGFQDVIATAQLMGYCPETLLLIGCQPEELEDYGGGLRDIVAAQIAPAVEIALARLAGWGITARAGRGDHSQLAAPATTGFSRKRSEPMCVGIPMQVIAVDGIAARASDGRDEALIDLSLTGPVQPGTWLLTFLGAAREVITANEAARIAAALDGLRAVMAGGTAGDAFADLDARAPQLPPHLQAALDAGKTTA